MERPPASSRSKYVRDFESLFGPVQDTQIIDKSRNGTLDQSQFRSICWRYFLGCLPKNHDDWLIVCSSKRKHYEDISRKNLAVRKSNQSCSTDKSVNRQQQTSDVTKQTESSKIYPLEIPSINKEHEQEQRYIKALSQSDQTNASNAIERDVIRTFPDMDFFRQTEIQNTLINVLFNYACENPHLSYKQGMHELLATLYYVLHTDTQNCLIHYQGGYANEVIAGLLDFKYIEHDLYDIFCALMESLETWYQNDEIITNHNPKIQTIGSMNSNRRQVNSVLGLKLKKISESIVRMQDPELYNHLEALQIAPQIYGIRWMRLLFGREFGFLDLLRIWDAIICDRIPMSLTEYIFSSMLLTHREKLVNGDYTDCLNHLMRHQFKDTHQVITFALHLRDPIKNNRPQTRR